MSWKINTVYAILSNQKILISFIVKLKNLLKNKNLKKAWKTKQQIFLQDKIDVTAFFTWFIENYPQSRKIMQDNPAYQLIFK